MAKKKYHVVVAILIGISLAKFGDYLVVICMDHDDMLAKFHIKNLDIVFVNPTTQQHVTTTTTTTTSSSSNVNKLNPFQQKESSQEAAVLSSSISFNKIVQFAYDKALEPPQPSPSQLQQNQNEEEEQHQFKNIKSNINNINISAWEHTSGGLDDQDRILLAKIYGSVDSVFEYGLGESTAIASYMNVSRYSGIDSDALWVSQARKKSLSHFRFYFADIGVTEIWGNPVQTNLSKAILNYQLLPLISEPYPFDAYLVDGRWRLPCLLASFLHASARGANTNDTIVMVHDCTTRQKYHKADHLLDQIDFSGHRLCVYKRKPNTTNEQLMEIWLQNFHQSS